MALYKSVYCYYFKIYLLLLLAGVGELWPGRPICVCVRHKSEFYRNGWTDRAGVFTSAGVGELYGLNSLSTSKLTSFSSFCQKPPIRRAGRRLYTMYRRHFKGWKVIKNENGVTRVDSINQANVVAFVRLMFIALVITHVCDILLYIVLK